MVSRKDSIKRLLTGDVKVLTRVGLFPGMARTILEHVGFPYLSIWECMHVQLNLKLTINKKTNDFPSWR